MEFDVLIPARYASTRLPGKPLQDICGKPLIQWVCDCAATSAAQRVLVATDDPRVKDVVDGFGGQAYLTRGDHASGSDRVAELVQRLGLQQDRIVVNVQGDEPRMPGLLIDQVAGVLAGDDATLVSTACHKIESEDELNDPNVVKVVCDLKGRALYFSRAAIPCARDSVVGGVPALRHIGIYGFRAGFLGKFTSWPATELEKTEQLEQLRILENGVDIAVCEAMALPGPGIDTPADLENFRDWVSRNG